MGHNDARQRVCAIFDHETDDQVISWYTDHTDNPEHLHFRIKYVNADLAQEMGLILNQRSWRDKSDGILDALYYDVNDLFLV